FLDPPWRGCAASCALGFRGSPRSVGTGGRGPPHVVQAGAFSASSRSRPPRSSSPVISDFHGGRPSLLKACPFEPPLGFQARSRASCRLSTLFMNHPPLSPLTQPLVGWYPRLLECSQSMP